jgi:hypothetical protein
MRFQFSKQEKAINLVRAKPARFVLCVAKRPNDGSGGFNPPSPATNGPFRRVETIDPDRRREGAV